MTDGATMLRKFKTISRGWGAVISLSLLTAATVADIVTGPNVSVLPLYMLPVCAMAWFCGGLWGFAMSVASALCWLVVNYVSKPGGMTAVTVEWNAAMRLVGFVIVAYTTAAMRQLGRRVEELVAEQTVVLTAEVEERKRAEAAVHALTLQLSEAEDVQRKRLAQDIHDTLGQTLTVIKMNLEGMIEGSDEWQAQRLQESLKLIESMIRQTRTMTFELYPAMLEDLGLLPTIRRYAEQMQTTTGIRTTVSEVGKVQKLPMHTANYLFRAAKELINNANKHGRANEIMVSVHWREGGMRMVVDDDGVGFDVGKALEPKSYKGLGLASIRERISSLGGEVHIESSVGNGTRVILELEIPRESLAAKEN